MHSKGNYENNSEDGVWQGRLDDHKDDGIVHARVILANDLLQLASHDKQSIRHENGINHSEPHLDAEVGKYDVDIEKTGAGACLHQDDNRQCCSGRSVTTPAGSKCCNFTNHGNIT